MSGARADHPRAVLSRPARSRLDRSRLPEPLDYYSRELPDLKGRAEWRTALCPFHPDTQPSLRVNMATGGWRCMACGRGGDLLKFHMLRHGLSFPDACKALGVWTGGRRHA